jgi:hypothetical protein
MQLRQLFDRLDTDKSGTIDADEIADMLKKKGRPEHVVQKVREKNRGIQYSYEDFKAVVDGSAGSDVDSDDSELDTPHLRNQISEMAGMTSLGGRAMSRVRSQINSEKVSRRGSFDGCLDNDLTQMSTAQLVEQSQRFQHESQRCQLEIQRRLVAYQNKDRSALHGLTAASPRNPHN